MPEPRKHHIEWEMIEESLWEATNRVKVPHGWLVKIINRGTNTTNSITFYPDPFHEWNPVPKS